MLTSRRLPPGVLKTRWSMRSCEGARSVRHLGPCACASSHLLHAGAVELAQGAVDARLLAGARRAVDEQGRKVLAGRGLPRTVSSHLLHAGDAHERADALAEVVMVGEILEPLGRVLVDEELHARSEGGLCDALCSETRAMMPGEQIDVALVGATTSSDGPTRRSAARERVALAHDAAARLTGPAGAAAGSFLRLPHPRTGPRRVSPMLGGVGGLDAWWAV